MPKYRTVGKDDNSRTAKRIFLVGGFLALCFGMLFCRAISFRLKDNGQLENVALRQYRTAVRESTKRGKILDRKGRELAFDMKVDSIFANPMEIESPVKAAEDLSTALGVNRKKLLDRLSAKRKFVWVKRRASDDESAVVDTLKLKGVYKMRESKRFYPGKKLASSVLGAVGFDSEPLGGIELAYDDKLSTRKGPVNFRRDARGHLYLSPTDDEDPSLYSVKLTIDSTLQYITERELEKGVKSSRSKSGVAIVVDVKTGELLAMASYPTFNPNEYSKYPFSHWKNRAVADLYEPGSTFKAIVVAAALEAGVVKPEDVVNCENGKIRIGNHTVGDAHPHGKLTVADVIKVSSNIGAYKIERKLGKDALYSAILGFGFGKETGIDLPGESAGISSPPAKWSPLQYATIAFGQGIATTPLQMTMAFAAIANGGYLLKPYIVKQVVSNEDEVIFEGNRHVVGNPISPATSKTMTELLRRVVSEDGTGPLAYSSEYIMAGKTGTAQMANPRTGGYMKGKYHSSFIGFAPADNPIIAVYVSFDEPMGKYYYGGQIAAPVFREIVESTLHYFKVPANTMQVSNDVLNQLPPKKVHGELATIDGGGAEVLDAGIQRNMFISEKGGKRWMMPDVRGLTSRNILAGSRNIEIDWQFEGSGIAVSQSVDPGATVMSGAICKVVFKPLM